MSLCPNIDSQLLIHRPLTCASSDTAFSILLPGKFFTSNSPQLRSVMPCGLCHIRWKLLAWFWIIPRQAPNLHLACNLSIFSLLADTKTVCRLGIQSNIDASQLVSCLSWQIWPMESNSMSCMASSFELHWKVEWHMTTDGEWCAGPLVNRLHQDHLHLALKQFHFDGMHSCCRMIRSALGPWCPVRMHVSKSAIVCRIVLYQHHATWSMPQTPLLLSWFLHWLVVLQIWLLLCIFPLVSFHLSHEYFDLWFKCVHQETFLRWICWFHCFYWCSVPPWFLSCFSWNAALAYWFFLLGNSNISFDFTPCIAMFIVY